MYQILEICGIPGLKGCIGDSQKVCAVLLRPCAQLAIFYAAARPARSARGWAASSLHPGGTAEGKQSGIALGRGCRHGTCASTRLSSGGWHGLGVDCGMTLSPALAEPF